MPPPPTPLPKRRARKRKATSDESSPGETGGSVKEAAPAPTTPNKRRAKATGPAAAPPTTPTPSSAKLIAEPAVIINGAATTPKQHPVVSRLADPNRTNAPLLSPETSRLVTAGSASASLSPSKAPQPRAAATTTTTTTAANILQEACAHLIRMDPRMKPLIDAHPCRIFSPEGLAEKIDPFESLCSGIISQQVSGAAAKAIKRRFVELFSPPDDDDHRQHEGDGNGGGNAIDDERQEEKKTRFPHPSQVAACPIDRLRSAGLSQRKAEYVRGLAEKFGSGELSARLLADAPYEEVLARLTAVRGLGQWSVEMFACFALKRMDVFSLGDLGVQRGMAAFLGRDVAKLKAKGGKWKYMSETEMREVSERFAPYRSLFMWYMWRVEETDVSTME
ncbi:hypothetical protein DL766_001899 [Monosporascus sp. MC13-8B]|uniref:HhH-GPD domain-containing protein n=1 Tax=Monosporascus cannonballus TaxID=155416 RepID=A0ABY0GUU4_9PEZI|nr:hypothetical protein DL762_009024 [Monosporascus cannonballus]RYO79619.1 hypothetical protein DL763_009190 [Monosporascus cannonballus]RYP36659.1 hypothetical protein DL766_001899 [Monosporascus sp. MC13-8B]